MTKRPSKVTSPIKLWLEQQYIGHATPQRHGRVCPGPHAVTDAWSELAIPDDEASEPCRAPMFPIERMFWPVATTRPATKSAATSPVRMELYAFCGVCPCGWPQNAATRKCLVWQAMQSHSMLCVLAGCRSATRLDVLSKVEFDGNDRCTTNPKSRTISGQRLTTS